MKKFTLIHLFIILGNVGVPGLALFLAIFKSDPSYKWFFVVFIILHAFERVWETFFTSRERHPHEFHGDWPLALVTISYIIMCFFVIVEFFFFSTSISLLVTVIGFLIYFLSFGIRRWGMKSLGKQWSIHAVGAIKLKKYRLLKIGAYKYLRHPIYSGIILEEISIPLIANAFWALGFVFMVCLPLVIVRAMLEEKSSIRKFGNEYEKYRKKVGMFLPMQMFKIKIK